MKPIPIVVPPFSIGYTNPFIQELKNTYNSLMSIIPNCLSFIAPGI